MFREVGAFEQTHGVSTDSPRAPRISAVFRETERVTPLELFFDLVFVLAITQCTALMADDPTWAGLARGLLVLGVLWWAWVGYAWLTSVLDPEEGGVRLVMFVAMAALLVVALCVPGAFGDDALLFACAYGVVRFSQIGLFLIASRDNPALRQSVLGLAGGTAVGVGLIVVAAGLDGWAQTLVWALALALDMAEPFFFGSEGWSLEHPGHFAERHGLIVIIALGESIVAIGIGAGVAVDAGVVAAATLGIAGAAALWWLYFDVVALVAERSLARLPAGRERNERGRDSYSYLHFPMVAGIVLLALGLKKTVARRRARAGHRRRLRDVRRCGDLPARTRRLPAAKHRHGEPSAARLRRRAARVHPARRPCPGARWHSRS